MFLVANAKRLHEDKEDSAPPSSSDSLDGGNKRPDSSLGRRLAEGRSPDRADGTPIPSPTMSRCESLRGGNHRKAQINRKKSDPTHLDRDENDGEESRTRSKTMGLSESSSGSSPSLRSSESPMASMEGMDAASNEDSDFEADPDSMPSWQSYLPSQEIVEKLDERNRKRQDVIAELFHTERTHVRNLKVKFVCRKKAIGTSSHTSIPLRGPLLLNSNAAKLATINFDDSFQSIRCFLSFFKLLFNEINHHCDHFKNKFKSGGPRVAGRLKRRPANYLVNLNSTTAHSDDFCRVVSMSLRFFFE